MEFLSLIKFFNITDPLKFKIFENIDPLWGCYERVGFNIDHIDLSLIEKYHISIKALEGNP